MSEVELAQAAPATTPWGIAYRLLDLHERHTREGYRAETYPGDEIDALARALFTAQGRPLPEHLPVNRAQALQATRAEWEANAAGSPDPVWRVMVLETDWRKSYCGNYVIDAEICGPTSDDQDAIMKRAQELEAQGRAVRVVREGYEREVVWTGRLPWPHR